MQEKIGWVKEIQDGTRVRVSYNDLALSEEADFAALNCLPVRLQVNNTISETEFLWPYGQRS